MALVLFDWREPLYFLGVVIRWGDFNIDWNNAWLSALRLASFLLPNILIILSDTTDILGISGKIFNSF
jgi:hypothetical protein